MHQAYYMSAREYDPAKITDKAGGLPTHLPPKFPVSNAFGTQLCFLLQLYTDKIRLALPGILCIQVYQSGEINDGDDPSPVAIALPDNAPLNDSNLGRQNKDLDVIAISWQGPVNEPQEWPCSSGVTQDLMRLASSKLGGLRPQVDPPLGTCYIGQVSEALNDFNFGGLQLILWQHINGEISYQLI